MMYLMEPLFDVAYLGIIIGLGLRLLLERDRQAKNFGIMAMILGLGDAFHLLPRIVGNLTENGLNQYIFFLSWGEFVTSITMTFFYILFYHYYRKLSGDYERKKCSMIYILAVIRVILILLPQNQWGTRGNYWFGILRNIPFAIMGILLICWTWQYRNKDGLKHTSILISLSFLFYLPVVVGARFIPVLGVFMIPKTVAYVLLVVTGFRYFIKDFGAINILKDATVFLVLGLSGGVFYREFTKLFAWGQFSSLRVVHVHLMTLGCLTFLAIYALLRSENKKLTALRLPLRIYITGLAWTVTAFVVRGIYSIVSAEIKLFPEAALAGIAGVGHILLGSGMVWLFLELIRMQEEKQSVQYE